ncbi:hypothetical protein SAMN02745687_02576 [Lachnospiraceae bacterium NK3A20]|nr:hypothetical protein SAMN02745687_02576 [Lachnospiraceae bacterium NK3A20]
MKETYPMALRVYKGEGRILIVPVVHHVYGYSVASDQYYNLEEDVSADQLGETIKTAIRFIMNSHLSTVTPKERDENAAWKKNTKYKSEISFWKNNHFARVHYDEEGQYHIYSLKRSERRKGAYEDRICQEDSCNSSAEEIGAAVLEVLRASESYYKKYKASAKEPHREIELAGGTKLIFNEPSGTEWEDCADSGSAEIYQCYRCLSKSEEEIAALFLGIAPELDCNLDRQNIYDSWSEIYGVPDCFQVQTVDYGIFSIRVEMRNKDIHKISYFRQEEDDLLLECSVEVREPRRRKTSDQKISKQFEELSGSCRLA